MQSKYLLRKNCGDWSGRERDCWEWRWKDEKRGGRRKKEGSGQRGSDRNKGRCCRVEHRDVTELIIGFCRDLAFPNPHFFQARAFVSLRPLLFPFFTANVRVAFNPERGYIRKQSARCNFSSLILVVRFSFYASLSYFDFFRHHFYLIGK